MSPIRHDRIGVIENADGTIDITVPPGMNEEFKLLVKRGTNTYPSQHVEIRDFADRLLRPEIQSPCMKTEIYGYATYEQQRVAEAETKKEPPKLIPYCQGHPETCNCDYHAG